MTNSLTAGLPPVHPGEVLKEDILPAVKATRKELADRLGISRQTLYDLLNGETPVSSLLALKLERLFGGSAEMWCNLQRDHDLAVARREKAEELDQIESLAAA